MVKMTQTIKIVLDINSAKQFAKIISEDIAKRFLYEMILLKSLPEIEKIKSKKIKGYSYEEIKRYLERKIKS